MCIIVYSPEGNGLPTKARLDQCWRNNPDGAGLMWAADGAVHLRKGLMSMTAVHQCLKEAAVAWDSVPVVLHFRIGTQGPNDATLTHPFPVTDSLDLLTAPMSEAPVALAHNGIIRLTTSWRKDDPFSDTLYFVRDYASLVARTTKWHRDTDKVTLLARLAQSKLAILSADGHCELIGGFEDGGDGCRYSNDSYKARTAVMTWPGGSLQDWSDSLHTTKHTAHKARPTKARQLALASADDTEVRVSFQCDGNGLRAFDDRNRLIGPADSDMYAVTASGTLYLADLDSDVVMPLPGWTLRGKDGRKWRPGRTASFHTFKVLDL